MLDAWCMPVCAQKAGRVTKVTLYNIVLWDLSNDNPCFK